jgi:hypothetical protein
LINKLVLFGLFIFSVAYSRSTSAYLLTPSNSSAGINFNQINQQDSIFPGHSELEEVYLSFNYYGIVNRTLTVNYSGKFLLPFGEIFDQLVINYTFDRQKNIIRGFYINEENTYELNFDSLNFKSVDKEFKFSVNDFIIKDFEYYLTADLFYKAFNLSFSVDINNLALNLATTDVLPIYSKYLREQKYNYISTEKMLETYPLLFPREKSYFRGAFADYSLSSTYSRNNFPFYSYNLGVGTEILGGDFQALTNGYTAGNQVSNSEFDYRWRYGLERNNYLTQVSFGNLIGSGINPQTYEGIMLSNQPLEVRESFAKFLISEQTKPGSTIELYINNQLVNYTRTDAAGIFNFWIPLTYGSSFVKLKIYEPTGETKIIDRYYQTPYTLNPPEEFNYTVNLGKIEQKKTNYFQASGVYGFNDWISNLIGVEYLNDKLLDKPVFFNSLTARLGSGYLLNILTAPNAFYQLSASAVYPSLTSINLSYKNYAANFLYNPANIKNEFSSNLNLPIYLDYSPLNIQMSGVYQSFNYSSDLYDLRFSSSKNFENFTPTLLYSFRQFSNQITVFRQSYLSTGLIYTTGSLPASLSFIKALSANSGINYNITNRKIESFFLSAASNISNNIRVQLDFERNVNFNISNTRLHAFIELPFTKAYSTIGKDYYTTNLQGSLLFNDFTNQINFFNREQIGRSAALFRMFVDENGNAIFDEGEAPIRGSKVNIQSFSSNLTIIDNEAQVRDLNPFTTYKVEVDESSFDNPLVTAKNKFFSFEAGPNYIKNIDIPFYISNEVSGNVNKIIDSAKSPVAGIKVYIEGIDNDQKLIINTFSDGSFYHYGLRPGTFKAYLDKEQLNRINSNSDPTELVFHIHSSSEGISIGNLDFILSRK